MGPLSHGPVPPPARSARQLYCLGRPTCAALNLANLGEAPSFKPGSLSPTQLARRRNPSDRQPTDPGAPGRRWRAAGSTSSSPATDSISTPSGSSPSQAPTTPPSAVSTCTPTSHPTLLAQHQIMRIGRPRVDPTLSSTTSSTSVQRAVSRSASVSRRSSSTPSCSPHERRSDRLLDGVRPMFDPDRRSGRLAVPAPGSSRVRPPRLRNVLEVVHPFRVVAGDSSRLPTRPASASQISTYSQRIQQFPLHDSARRNRTGSNRPAASSQSVPAQMRPVAQHCQRAAGPQVLTTLPDDALHQGVAAADSLPGRRGEIPGRAATSRKAGCW